MKKETEQKKEVKGEEEKKEEKKEEEKKQSDKKEEGNPREVVLNVDLHCEGCAMKVKKAIRAVKGVDRVSIDYSNNKITVKGDLDPWILKECVESKTKKNVEIISPKNPPKKKDRGENKDKKDQKEDKKLKEVQDSTVVLKIPLHCAGCIDRIKRTIYRIKGVKEVTTDEAKDLVTIKGTMDIKSLPNYLQEKLKRNVEMVPTKKQDDGGENKEKDGDKKEKGKENNNNNNNNKKEKKKDKKNKGEKKEEEKKEEKKEEKENKEEKKEDKEIEAIKPTIVDPVDVKSVCNSSDMISKFDFFAPHEYRGPMIMDAPQIFSDENPNACAVM
ncbi:hypothetical protein LUZ60_002395 [Juncus effusus]|nr:hypothetical protein LUZ60_002395 [Juncus effusus]